MTLRSTGPVSRIRLPQKLRNLELALLAFSFAITGLAVLLVELGVRGTFDPGLAMLLCGLACLALGVHVTLRVRARDADPFILPIATTLNGLGITMIYRIDLAEGVSGFDSVAIRQVLWSAIAIGAALATVGLLRNHRTLFRYTYIFGFVAIVLLVMPLVPGIGLEVSGARAWVAIGGVSFQPGEVAKIAIAVFFAGYLVRNRESLSLVGRRVLGVRLPRVRDLGPMLVMWAAAMTVMVFQHDLGTALLYFGMFLAMLYVATGQFSWVAIGLGLFGSGAALVASRLSYVQGRFHNWLHAFDASTYDTDGGSYQLVQGIFGLAHGGLIGTGWGLGRPDITPVPQSDYIIASLGEELGLAGIFAILALYILLVARGFRIGFAGHDDFGKLLAVGLAFTVAFQVFIVVGGVTRVIPLTGLTTPFLAAGGSSLVANWVVIALLLRLSDTVRTQPRLVVE
ncbi:MAG TPA: FtsW/RodA/SpoVE family cell cycle protein [Microbacteriaceae bacterium]|nr:FtsW/RodA/SpoVE family cell cycle protein [Microbacteriaceae bacterium]